MTVWQENLGVLLDGLLLRIVVAFLDEPINENWKGYIYCSKQQCQQGAKDV
jgi:hypothetical protein